MHKVYKYNSCFSELITQYISERRNSGFMFDNPAYLQILLERYAYSEIGGTFILI